MLHLTPIFVSHDRSFLYQPRGFNNIYSMNDAIIRKWNDTVNIDDDIYLLGDVMLNDDEYGIKCLKSLKGNIHIIRGNHDSDNRIKLYKNCYNVVEVCEGKFLKYKNYHFYLSHYPAITANYDDDKPLKAKTISLCGHYHTKDKFIDMNKGVIYHCELDAHNLSPIKIDDIITDIQNYINMIIKKG